jgi:hypothetical protein
MKQTRLISAIEAFVNIAIGMGVALGSQYLIFPLFDIHISHSSHLQITFWFTLISFARSYFIRRWFSNKLNKALAKWMK